MVLTLDIGNTQSVLGLWEEDTLIDTARVSTNSSRTKDEWSWVLADFLQDRSVSISIYSSVVPNQNISIEMAFSKLGVKDIRHLTANDAPFQFDYPGKKTLGEDRVANVIAALKLYGDNFVIVDFGTAVTFCLIENGVYKRSLITPGVYTALNSLFKQTATLPQVSLPSKIDDFGKDTLSSIEAGAYLAFKGMVKEILTKISHINTNNPLLIATGGIIESLGFAEEMFDVIDRNLTLKGLFTFYQEG